MVQPDVAVFGAKDFQQLQLIRHLVRDLAFPVEVVAGATAREPDGLAMSSRNRYLDPDQRARAPEIHRTLQAIRDGFRQGLAVPDLEEAARQRLAAAGFDVDYIEVRRMHDLGPPAGDGDGPLGAFAAARLGRTRLIDNLSL
jgi:pantoate--beta-alanine ligase